MLEIRLSLSPAAPPPFLFRASIFHPPQRPSTNPEPALYAQSMFIDNTEATRAENGTTRRSSHYTEWFKYNHFLKLLCFCVPCVNCRFWAGLIGKVFVRPGQSFRLLIVNSVWPWLRPFSPRLGIFHVSKYHTLSASSSTTSIPSSSLIILCQTNQDDGSPPTL